MKFTPQSIADVILIEHTIHGDDRGYFVETLRQDLLEEAIGYKVNFVQDNESKSKGIIFNECSTDEDKSECVINKQKDANNETN